MPSVMTDDETDRRRARVLAAARWCFLNFGFGKTALGDIAKRAGLSRTLLYRTFANKEDIFRAVFLDWLVARRPDAERVATGPGSAAVRLLGICRIMALEPWAEMVGAAMGGEFIEVCQQIDPESEARYRDALQGCVRSVLEDEASTEVFLLAFDGLFADRPSVEVLEQRTRLLVDRFAPRSSRRRRS